MARSRRTWTRIIGEIMSIAVVDRRRSLLPTLNLLLAGGAVVLALSLSLPTTWDQRGRCRSPGC